MRRRGNSHRLMLILITICADLTFAARLVRAQDTPPSNGGTTAQSPVPHDGQADGHWSARRPTGYDEHRFWDKENDLLFAGVAAMRTADYFSTLNMRRRGRQEVFLTNDAVDNHAGFAFIEAGATGVSIGASYLFHRYNHHKLERWTSIVHIGLAGGGAIRNYSLKTAHF